MRLEKIVCHVDLSPRSLSGAELAAALAARHSAQLVLVHADELPELAASIERNEETPGHRGPHRLAIDHERSVRRRMSSLSERLRAKTNVSTTTEILRDNSVDNFVDYVDDVGADLIVVGADEPSAIRRLLRQSVTESVARRAPCPVLALTADTDVDAPLRHLLVAVDYSEQSRNAANAAAQLAGTGGSLSLVHVWIEQQTSSHRRPGLRELARLRNFADSLDLDGIELALYIETGDPVTQIARRARELRTDAVVIGSHPHGGWRDRVFGTLSDRLLEKVDCPVLTVPERRHFEEPRHPESSMIDETLVESFPASDPPSWWSGRGKEA